MPQEYFRQANFTNGELDPAMLGRRDLKAYFFSTAAALNHITSPQGPIGRRPGLAAVARIRQPLSLLVGGTRSAINSGALGATNPFVIATVDFGAPVAVSVIDVTDYRAVAAGGGGNVTVTTGPGGPDGGGGSGNTTAPVVVSASFPTAGLETETTANITANLSIFQINISAGGGLSELP